MHIDDGFDFLGFNLRKYHGKLLTKPAPTSIAAVKETIRRLIRASLGFAQDGLIRLLNPILRGWGHYYRRVVSKRVFTAIDHAIWRMTWNWARRRHPGRGGPWIKARYYARKGRADWVFTDGAEVLFSLASIPIRRHVKIRAEANPYDASWAAYFINRTARYGQARPGTLAWLSP